MKTLLITNRKGGVGKTTTSVNLAASLGLKGQSVLIIDLDTQGNVQYGFGFKKPFKDGIHSAMVNNLDLNSIIYETKYENVFLIPANINFEMFKIRQNNKQLAKLIKASRIKDSFDVCIIDTPPTSDILLSNALVVSDAAIVPLKTDFLSVIGVEQFLKIFYTTASKVNPKLELLGLLPTMYNRSIKEHSTVIKDIENKVGKKRVLTPIRNDIKLTWAFLEGEPIAYIDKRCRGNKDYESLARTVMDKFGLK
jgi:chromosome partitioning protein